MAPYLLAEVYPATEQQPKIVVVYIPNVQDYRKQSNPIQWDKIIPRISPDPKHTVVLEYKHAISIKEPFPWLLDRGATLFIELFDHHLPCRQYTDSDLPSVYLIGELMGGIIIKQAFASTIHRGYAWKKPLGSIRGIFLLAVPQIDLDEHRQRFALALQTKTIRESSLSSKSLEAICVSSQQFKQVVKTHCPALSVVSAYNSLPSRSGLKHIFHRISTIPETAVRVGLGAQETTLDVICDLKSVWDASSASAFVESIRTHIDQTHSQSLQNAQEEPSPSEGDSGLRAIIPPPSGEPVPLPLRTPETAGQLSGSSAVTLTTPSSLGNNLRSTPIIAVRNPLPACITVQVPFQYPESFLDRHAYFAGRDQELGTIHRQLSPLTPQAGDASMLKSMCLSGMGGLGKTELAYQFAKTYHKTFDVIMIVKSDTTFRLKRTFSKIAAKLGLLSGADNPNDDECREALKAWLKRPYRTPDSGSVSEKMQEAGSIVASWLLIFDNVDHWADLKPYWPDKGRGSVLVTTRKPDLLSHLETPESISSLELDPLPMQEAGILLSHFAGCGENSSTTSKKAAEELAYRLGGLPLAVMQVGAYIKQCKLTILDFCQAHPKESDLYTVYLDEHRVQDYEYNLASVWALRPSNTSDGTLEQPSRLLCIMSLLVSEGISEELLEPDPAADELPGYPSDEPEFIQQYRDLINASLVDKKSKSKFTVHRLVQKVTRAQIVGDKVLTKQVFNHTLSRLTSRWPYTSSTQSNIDRWKICKKWASHIYALSQAYIEFTERGSLETPSLNLAGLLNKLAAYFAATSQPREASRILDISETICASASSLTDTISYDLEIYRGRLEVASILRDEETYLHYAKKELASETAKSSQPSSALAEANLHMGIAYGFHSLWKEARNYFKASMKIRRDLHGFRKEWMFSPYYQLGHTYFHLNKDDKAVRYLELALSDQLETSGEDNIHSLRTGALLYTLGDVKTRQGRTDEGLRLHVMAHAHLEQTAGHSSHATLHCKYKMAKHYVRLHSYTIARQYLAEILTHYRMVEHLRPYICRTAWLYAKAMPEDEPEAKSMLEEASQVFNEYSKYEKRRPNTLTELDAQSLVAYDYLSFVSADMSS